MLDVNQYYRLQYQILKVTYKMLQYQINEKSNGSVMCSNWQIHSGGQLHAIERELKSM